ncbi:MAG: hypothetical protein PHQ58_18680 [Rhodoferax sp.]|uniref:hypothetical protein n=1 Tax=Rhodoferax sp. TaxID=50421 RepID=UPI00261370FD|nr:hypothetical protein [Rhodoferax sp.]MDD2882455.1 hypothetical protein [Rhodoferax sp.]
MEIIEIRATKVEDLPTVAEMFGLSRQFYWRPSDRSLALRFLSDRLGVCRAGLLPVDMQFEFAN